MLIVHDGQSKFDGRPILGILTFNSRNRKTGPMAQLWILDREEPPHKAIKSGADSSICGDCKLRGKALGTRNKGRRCYVSTFQAPLSIWQAWKAGAYREPRKGELKAYLAFQALRLGAYGDPAALPLSLVRGLARMSARWTGYTHAWKRFSGLQAICMASVETRAESALARSLGWRTFRISSGIHDVDHGELLCPASPESGSIAFCASCELCSGSGLSAKSIANPGHGPMKGKGGQG
jgi:hypothetical protein